MISLLLMVLIAIAFYVLFQKYKPTSFNSRRHFALIIGYIVFLFAVLVTTEIVERLYQPHASIADPNEFNYDLSIGDIEEAVHSSQFLEKRTHQADDTLTIQNEYDGASLFVERRSNLEGIIEEFIFKPMLLINKRDFSDKINVKKPVWQDSLITIPQQPMTKIQYAHSYDTVFLNQLTSSRYSSSGSGSYTAGHFIIYLIVPEDVEIEVSSKSSIQYIEE